MKFDIFTLFPEMFRGPFDESIIRRAVDAGLVEIAVHNIRDYTTDRHHVTDDYPYGGGGGMVMKPEPIFAAAEAVLGQRPSAPVLLTTPQGRVFNQAIARELARQPRIAIICGHYEGVDERVREHLVTDELSIGDYVLTGGDLPAMVIVDAVTRLIHGVLGDPAAPSKDSFAADLLEGPHYTRPPVFRGWAVPEILLSGNHAAVARWRREQSLKRTFERRPDLLERAELSERDRAFLEALRGELPGTVS